MKNLFLFTGFLFAALFSRAQWETDLRLTNNPFTSINYSHHYIASSGDTVHVVWYDDRDGNNEIYYKRSVDGGFTWGEDIRLTNTPYSSTTAAIAVSGSVVHLAWAEDIVGNFEIYYKRSEDGGDSWGDDVQITDTPGTTSGNCLSVTGSLLNLVYYDQSDGWWEVYFKRSTDGGLTWEPEVRLTNEPSLSGNTSVSSTDSLVHVVWDEQRDGNREIYYKRSTDAGITWEDDTRLTLDNYKSWVPAVCAAGTDVYVAWDDNRDGYSKIYFKRSYDGGMTWYADTALTNTSGDSKFPNITVSGKALFVVWVDYSDGNMEVYYKHSTDGGGSWGQDMRLTDNAEISNYPDVSVSGTQVNVAWNEFRDGNYEIYYKRNPTGNLPLGIDDATMIGSDGRINVYPNPASDELTIGQSGGWTVGQSAVSSQQLAVRCSVVDLFGRDVKYIGLINAFPYQVDISELPDGIYILKMMDEAGNERSTKFVKIKE